MTLVLVTGTPKPTGANLKFDFILDGKLFALYTLSTLSTLKEKKRDARDQ